MPDDRLDRCNTFGLPSRADRLVVARTEQALVGQLRRMASHEPLTVLGGGSNVVLRARLPGTVLLVRTRGMRLEVASDERVLLTAAAGERWHDLVRYSLGQGLGGLENLALIPGSAGAAPIQNIGAYGVELADRLVGLRAFDRASGKICRFDRTACAFGYRDSVFKSGAPGRYVILDVTLGLSTRPLLETGYPELRAELVAMGRVTPSPVDVAEAVVRVRRRKLPDPRRFGNAGSFFKNPIVTADAARRLRQANPGLVMHETPDGNMKLAAAQLIDRCGWKGRRQGAAGVWPRHALVLVNFGGAHAPDLLRLAEEIRRDVHARFGVDLVFEAQVLGQD
ncbi:MAG: UDP-N-acetylmuramate dehydrogenase [Pseudomonadales bacterium]|nr:UDP-N-acetylmuramate dehydrogenase [Pseudomonadales bacterium]